MESSLFGPELSHLAGTLLTKVTEIFNSEGQRFEIFIRLCNSTPGKSIQYKGRTIIFLLEGGGYHFWELQTIFFVKSNAFQTIFFIIFCNEDNFL